MTDCTKQTTQIMKHENEYDPPPPQKKISASGLLKKKKKNHKKMIRIYGITVKFIIA